VNSFGYLIYTYAEYLFSLNEDRSLRKKVLAFYSAFAGFFFWYSQSRYYPKERFRPQWKGVKFCSVGLLLLSIVLYVAEYGWSRGMLTGLSSFMLILVLLQLFSVTGRTFFVTLMAIVHLLLAGDIFFHLSRLM